jgi:hypothetical protein
MGLPWFRADTNLPTHDKILELLGKGPKGKGAAFVYVCSIAHSVGHGTDGFIARAALPFIHASTLEARLLAEVRLWEVVEGGWQIKNFGTRQLIGAMQQAAQEERSESARKSANARWHPKEER